MLIGSGRKEKNNDTTRVKEYNYMEMMGFSRVQAATVVSILAGMILIIVFEILILINKRWMG